MPDRLRQIALFELGGLLLLLSALLGAPAHGQALPIPIGTEASLPFAAAAELFSETGSRRDVAEVAQSAAFRPLTRQDLLPSYDEGVYWLRATLINRNPQPIERWLVLGSSRLEAVTLFEPEAGGWRATRAGLSVPVQHKPVVAAGVVLPLALAVGEARTVLLRIESRTLIDLDASLWQPLAYLQAQEGRLLLHSLSFGGSLIAALTALFLFGRLRERSYLFFFLLHLSAALTEFGRNGLLERFLWPSTLALPLQLHLVSVTGVVLSLSLLLRSFLELPRTHPGSDRLLLLIAAAFLLVLPWSFVDYNQAARLAATLFILFALLSAAVTVWAWRQGRAAALYLIGAYAILWLSEVLRNLVHLGLLDLGYTRHASASLSLLLATPMIFLALTENTRRLAAELSQARALARSKSEFLARISHELRTPLNTIIGYARMLGRGSRRLSLQEGSADIERSGLRLLGLIEDLLEQARLDAGQFRLVPQAVALSPWLDELERAGSLLAEAAGNSFALVRDGELPVGVEFDASRLRQVLDNLLSNAQRHTRHGRVELHCTARLLGNGQRVRLAFEVSDNGDGIASEDLPRIFEPFYRGRATRALPGLRGKRIGLGLSIARELVRLMGQELTVSSTPGRGTSFRFGVECPVVAAPPAPLAPAASRRPPLPRRRPVPQPAVLPDAARLAALAELVAGGQVTEIEEWCAALVEHHPACAEFALAVQQAVAELDFVALQHLARAGS